MMFDIWPFIIQVRAWRNLHGFEPGSDILSKLRDLIGPVCQRRGARGQQRLLLWEMQGEGQYSNALQAFILPHTHTDVMCTYNVYLCWPAQRTTVKRTCIKSLPSVLCIHLMRFGFDWESGRSIKYDEQIRVRRSQISIHLGYTFWFSNNTANPRNTNMIYMNSVLLVHSSPGCWTWSPTPSLEWLDKTAAGREVRGEATGPQEDHPGRKSRSQRTMNLSELLSTAVRHMLDTITPSLKTDGKRWRTNILWKSKTFWVQCVRQSYVLQSPLIVFSSSCS